MQRAQGVLLFLVCFNNSTRFEIYGVTCSSSSRLFLCALARTHLEQIKWTSRSLGTQDSISTAPPWHL